MRGRPRFRGPARCIGSVDTDEARLSGLGGLYSSLTDFDSSLGVRLDIVGGDFALDFVTIGFGRGTEVDDCSDCSDLVGVAAFAFAFY